MSQPGEARSPPPSPSTSSPARASGGASAAPRSDHHHAGAGVPLPRLAAQGLRSAALSGRRGAGCGGVRHEGMPTLSLGGSAARPAGCWQGPHGCIPARGGPLCHAGTCADTLTSAAPLPALPGVGAPGGWVLLGIGAVGDGCSWRWVLPGMGAPGDGCFQGWVLLGMGAPDDGCSQGQGAPEPAGGLDAALISTSLLRQAQWHAGMAPAPALAGVQLGKRAVPAPASPGASPSAVVLSVWFSCSR